MKKKLLLFFICLSTFIFLNGLSVNAQPPTWQWAKKATGNNFDGGQGITTDSMGNILVTGRFRSPTIIFGSTTLVNTNNTGNTEDFFIAKYDSIGNLLWAKSAGGTGGDGGGSIKTDVSGSILVTGYFYSQSIAFGSTTLINANSTGLEDDIFIVKYDPSGNVLWAQRAGGVGSDAGYGISTDSNKNILLTGEFRSSIIIFGNDTLTNSGGSCMGGCHDIFIAKYDSYGNVLWAKRNGGIYDDDGSSISTDVNGNVLITGYFKSPQIILSSDTLINAVNTGNSYDMFIAKYSPSGNLLWAKRAGGTSNDMAWGTTADNSGNVIVTGYFGSSTITFGNDTLTNADNSGNTVDVFVVKYDTSGKELWAKRAGGISNDIAWAISTDTNGNVITTGDFESTAIVFGIDTLKNAGGSDIFVSKYSSSGNVIWGKSAGGTNGDIGYGIVADKNGSVLLTGYFSSPTIAFGSTVLTNTTGSGYYDLFVAKLRECNIATPTVTVSGATTFCQGNDVTLTSSSGNSYLWSNNATTQNIIVSTSGNYSVTVTNAGNCSVASAVMPVTVLTATASITPSGATTFCQGNSITLTANSGNTYIWSNNATTQNIIVNQSGSYTVAVSSTCGSSTSSPVTVTVNSTSSVSATSTPASCSIANGTATANAYGGTAPYTIIWSTTPVQNTQTATGLSSGNYSVQVTDANGCTNATSVNVTGNPNPTASATSTQASSCSTCDGTATVNPSGGTPSYTYLWNPSGQFTQTATGLCVGTYTVIVTD